MTDKKTKVSKAPVRKPARPSEERGYTGITPPKPPPEKPSTNSGGGKK